MKTKILGVLAGTLMLASTAFGQDYAFKVFGSKGSNALNGSPLKIGAKLHETETVTVGESSYLGLANKQGKIVELTAKGTYKVKDLMSKASSPSSSLGSKYASFVLSELTKDEDEDAATNRSRHMNKTGSVERSFDKVVVVPNIAHDPDKQHTYNNKVYGNGAFIKWYLKDGLDFKESDLKGYKVLVLDMSDRILVNQFSNENNIRIDLSRKELINESNLIVKVIPVGKDDTDKVNAQEIEGKVIMRMSAEEQKKVSQELTSLNNGSPMVAKLIQARYFEEQELYMDAMMVYEDLLKSERDAKVEQMYQDFLFRNALTKDQAQAAFENSVGGDKK
jgi:hypothetical protein